jgi:hypothetical protein
VMAFQILKLRMNGSTLPFILHDFETSIKGRTAPLQPWSGPECSRKLRFPDFMTAAQDGGKVVNLTHRLPLPQEINLVLISVRG